MHLLPTFLNLYGAGQIDITETTIYHADTAPYRHEIRNNSPIQCQWCGASPLQIHTSGLGQFSTKTGFSVEEWEFIKN